MAFGFPLCDSYTLGRLYNKPWLRMKGSCLKKLPKARPWTPQEFEEHVLLIFGSNDSFHPECAHEAAWDVLCHHHDPEEA
ncbi:hypothetical protein BaRGS_00002567 [Batillaria attramentaria]|uniref:Uncharacterized protein n=1 Tax=Batillaria attramentaria TaxID=370345 RepID=A0ABD0M476_9CAEN